MGLAVGAFLGFLGMTLVLVGDATTESDLRTPGLLLCWVALMAAALAVP